MRAYIGCAFFGLVLASDSNSFAQEQEQEQGYEAMNADSAPEW